MVLRFLKSSAQKIKNSLSPSAIGSRIKSLFSSGINEETLEELEEIFYEADLGVTTTMELVEKVRGLLKENPKATADEVLNTISGDLLQFLKTPEANDETKREGPLVLLVVGANGNGKTTSIAKIAKRFSDEGKKVLLAAADTFRAAAVEQLELWAGRLKVEIVKGQHGADPAAVTFDALSKAVSKGHDVVIIDTAGRLHTKTDLMGELEKIRRSCDKVLPGSPHETLLVLDVSIGQNAIDQAKTFNKYTPITGLVLTKLDGTARGGIVVAIQRELGSPVQFIGVGEGVEDLQPFEAKAFVEGLFS